jgi:hypothetical protein
MRPWGLAVLAAACLGWLGCGPQRQALLPAGTPHLAETVINGVQYGDTGRCVAQKSVSTVTITMQGKKEKIQMAAFFNHPDLLKIDIYSTLGVAVAQLIVQEREVTAYFPLEKKLFSGRIDSPIMQRVLGVDLELTDILSFYLRQRLEPEDLAIKPTLATDAQHYLLTCPHSQGTVRYGIDPDYTVAQKEWRAADGTPTKIYTARRYRVWDNPMAFPAAVTLTLPANGTVVEMLFSERNFMVERFPLDTFRLPIPDGLTPVPVE